MALDEILKPFKFVKKSFDVADEYVLRQYAKLVTKLEDSGWDKHDLALKVSAYGFFAPFMYRTVQWTNPEFVKTQRHIANSNISEIVEGMSIATSYLGLLVHDIVHSKYNLQKNSGNQEEHVEDSFNYYSSKLQRIVRLPMLSYGLKCFYDTFKLTLNNGNISETFDTLIFGIMISSLASSMYIKDSDKKILQKDPFWKKTLAWLSEKYHELKPQPALEPVPVREYSVLENIN